MRKIAISAVATIIGAISGQAAAQTSPNGELAALFKDVLDAKALRATRFEPSTSPVPALLGQPDIVASPNISTEPFTLTPQAGTDQQGKFQEGVTLDLNVGKLLGSLDVSSNSVSSFFDRNFFKNSEYAISFGYGANNDDSAFSASTLSVATRYIYRFGGDELDGEIREELADCLAAEDGMAEAFAELTDVAKLSKAQTDALEGGLTACGEKRAIQDFASKVEVGVGAIFKTPRNEDVSEEVDFAGLAIWPSYSVKLDPAPLLGPDRGVQDFNVGAFSTNLVLIPEFIVYGYVGLGEGVAAEESVPKRDRYEAGARFSLGGEAARIGFDATYAKVDGKDGLKDENFWRLGLEGRFKVSEKQDIGLRLGFDTSDDNEGGRIGVKYTF